MKYKNIGPKEPGKLAYLERLRKEGKKRCQSCRTILLFKDFHRDSTKKDGFNGRCITCIKKRQTKRA